MPDRSRGAHVEQANDLLAALVSLVVTQEVIRLLYVGTTRAIRQLTLSATLDARDSEASADLRDPNPDSLLAPIWHHFQLSMQLHHEVRDPGSSANANVGNLRRLAAVPSLTAAIETTATGGNIPERPANRLERAVGTSVHKALEDLSALAALPDGVNEGLRKAVHRHLRAQGLAGDTLAQALDRVLEHIDRVLADQQFGRWLLDGTHEQAASELPLTWLDDDGSVRDSIIDRTFVDGTTGDRWIIDYKTSRPLPDESVEAFASRELDTYRAQLEGYRTALAAQESKPVRCALYFTEISHLAHLDG